MKTLYFMDLDGTIEDSRQDMVASIVRVRAKFGLDSLMYDALVPFVTKGMNYLYENAFPELSSDLAKVQREYDSDYLAHVTDHTQLYTGMDQALAELSKFGKIFVVTNKPTNISEKLLLSLNVLKYISGVMGCDSCAETKPSPLPLKIIAARENFQPQIDCAYVIGDSAADMQMAENFGAKSIWCQWGYFTNPPVPKPFWVAKTPVDLVSITTNLTFPKFFSLQKQCWRNCAQDFFLFFCKRNYFR